MKMAYEKPPIGVAPHWFVYWERMLELSEAIGRYLEYIRIHENTMKLEQYYKAIARWSEELRALSELEAKLAEEAHDGQTI